MVFGPSVFVELILTLSLRVKCRMLGLTASPEPSGPMAEWCVQKSGAVRRWRRKRRKKGEGY